MTMSQALVLLADETLLICPLKAIDLSGNVFFVKCSDGKSDGVRVLAINNCDTFLRNLKLNLEGIIECIGGNWCLHKREMTHAEVYQEIMENQEQASYFLQLVQRKTNGNNDAINPDNRKRERAMLKLEFESTEQVTASSHSVQCGNNDKNGDYVSVTVGISDTDEKSAIKKAIIDEDASSSTKSAKPLDIMRTNTYDNRRQHAPGHGIDEVLHSLRNDELLKLYNSQQCRKYGVKYIPMIRCKVRLLIRLLMQLRSMDDNIWYLTDIYQPHVYDAVSAAIGILAGFDKDTELFRSPSTACRCGKVLKEFAEILRADFLKKKQRIEQEKVDKFLMLLTESYNRGTMRTVIGAQIQDECQKQISLPTTANIKKLHDFVKAERDKAFSQLVQEFSLESWKSLAASALLSLQIFNHRKPSDIETLKLQDLRAYHGIMQLADQDLYDSMDAEGKECVRKYISIQISDTSGGVVRVLTDIDVLGCLQLVVEHRANAGISAENPYVFALPSNDDDRSRHFCTNALMKEYSMKCVAEIPEVLQGSAEERELREHIAKKCITSNFTTNPVTDLVDFMSEQNKVYYCNMCGSRLSKVDVDKISKLMTIARGPEECHETQRNILSEASNHVLEAGLK